MLELDKRAIGSRIREIRLHSGLRQWELAKILGTTQSAIHKYEHGVIPEPRRLMVLARVGATSIEWILTGRHGEGGDEGRERPSQDVLHTAAALRRVDGPERKRIEQALRILHDAARAATHDMGDTDGPEAEIVRLLDSAERIRASIVGGLVRDAIARLRESEAPSATADEDP